MGTAVWVERVCPFALVGVEEGEGDDPVLPLLLLQAELTGSNKNINPRIRRVFTLNHWCCIFYLL
jgi:hypothetical protein